MSSVLPFAAGPDRLPGLNGVEVAWQLRELPGGRDMLVVALSGYGQVEDRRRSIEAGFDHHLVEPVDRERLNKVIATYAVGQKRQAQSGARTTS